MRRDGEFNFVLDPSKHQGYITFIQVTNAMDPEHLGYVTLSEGGVGHRNLTLLLESQRGEGYHFSIKIYTSSLIREQQQGSIKYTPVKFPTSEQEPYSDYKAPDSQQELVKSQEIPVKVSYPVIKQQQDQQQVSQEIPIIYPIPLVGQKSQQSIERQEEQQAQVQEIPLQDIFPPPQQNPKIYYNPSEIQEIEQQEIPLPIIP